MTLPTNCSRPGLRSGKDSRWPSDTARESIIWDRRRQWLPATILVGGGVGILTARRSARRSSGIDWAPPRGTSRDAALAVRTAGEGLPATVLLHGIFASGRYWGASYDALALEASLAVPDLAGFGRSAGVVDGFGPEAHADLVAHTIRDLGLGKEPVIIGAHSLGCLIAVGLARRHPELVAGIVAFSPPLYRDQGAAQQQLSRANVLIRLLVVNPRLGEAVCGWMCKHPGLAALLGRLARPDLPQPLAEDRFKHSYRSYSETLDKVILAAGAAAGIGEIAIPVHLVAGSADTIMDHDLLLEIAARHDHVRLSVWPGAEHELPLTHAVACVGEVERMRNKLVTGRISTAQPTSANDAEGPGPAEMPL